VARYGQACSLGNTPDVARKLDVLRGHCADLGRDYDEITKTVMTSLDPGPRGEKVDALLETLQKLAALGVTHAQGGVPDAASITPLEILGEKVIPVAATF
jgi:hypothetical protein